MSNDAAPTTDRTDETVIDSDLTVELHDVFHVMQLTRGTELETSVGADYVRLDRGRTSKIHRHNLAETVLYMVDGSGVVVIDDEDHPVVKGDRVRIRPGQYHGVRTTDEELTFISVQSPPILDESAGRFDLEPRER